MRSYTKKMVCHVPTQMQRGFSVLTETEGFSVLTETEGLTPGGVASLLHIKQMRYIKYKLNLLHFLTDKFLNVYILFDLLFLLILLQDLPVLI